MQRVGEERNEQGVKSKNRRVKKRSSDIVAESGIILATFQIFVL